MMSYLISVIVSVLVLGTLLTSLCYKREKYECGTYERIIDEGKVKFPLWVYILSVVISVIYIANYVVAFTSLLTALIYNPMKAESDFFSEHRTRIYLNIRIPFIKKFIELLNKRF